MDWDRYKRECDTPGVFSRWMLMQTLELLQPPLDARCDCLFEVRAALAAILSEKPIPKPVDHRGSALTDMFAVVLAPHQVRAVVEIVSTAVAGGTTTSGTRERGLGGFAEAWSEYLHALSTATKRPQ